MIDKINEKLPEIFDKHQTIRTKNNNSIVSEGAAMNVILSDDIFIELLKHFIDNGLIDALEKILFGNCIPNSFSALNNLKKESEVFHKNSQRFTFLLW